MFYYFNENAQYGNCDSVYLFIQESQHTSSSNKEREIRVQSAPRLI